MTVFHLRSHVWDVSVGRQVGVFDGRRHHGTSRPKSFIIAVPAYVVSISRPIHAQVSHTRGCG